MTSIKLHGALAKEFGSSFNFDIKTVKEAFDAIDANNPRFISKIKKLSAQGMHYAVIVNGKKLSELKKINEKQKIKEISIVPAIMGHGAVALAVATAAATAALGAALAAGAITMTTFIVASLVVGVVSMALQMMLAPKPPTPPAIEATTRALQDSFTFSNKVNLADQGVRVPVGYGRLLSASNVIEFMTKNYPQNKEPLEFYKNGTGTFSNSESNRTQRPVAWPSKPPLDYRGWVSNMSMNGALEFYFDPNIDHTGFVGGGWIPITFPQSVGSVKYSMANTGTGFVNVYIYYSTSGGYLPYAFTLNAQSLAPGQTLEGFLGQVPERFRTDWGSAEAKNRIAASVGATQRSYGGADGNVSKGFKGYGGDISRSGGRTMFMYMVPAGKPFSVKDKSNAIAQGVIRMSTAINVKYWNNKQFSDNPPFWDPVYPNGSCNGQACHQNQTPDTPGLGCYLPGWNAGFPFGASKPAKPCGPGGVGPVFRQNTDIGGIGPQVIIG